MNGLVIVVVVLAVATVIGLLMRRNEGRMRTVARPADLPRPTEPGDVDEAVHVATRSDHGGERVRADVIGAELGSVATFVQFSGPFCSVCGPTREMLRQIAGEYEGVVHVDIDCEERMDLVRQYDIRRTPTILVLDGTGTIVKRASGAPRRVEVLSTLGDLANDSL